MLLNISCYLHCLLLDKKTEKLGYKIPDSFPPFLEIKKNSFVKPYSEVRDALKLLSSSSISRN